MMLRKVATYLQMRCARMKRETLVMLFTILVALGCGVCFVIIYRSLDQPFPLHQIFPMKHDTITSK